MSVKIVSMKQCKMIKVYITKIQLVHRKQIVGITMDNICMLYIGNFAILYHAKKKFPKNWIFLLFSRMIRGWIGYSVKGAVFLAKAT